MGMNAQIIKMGMNAQIIKLGMNAQTIKMGIWMHKQLRGNECTNN